MCIYRLMNNPKRNKTSEKKRMQVIDSLKKRMMSKRYCAPFSTTNFLEKMI